MPRQHASPVLLPREGQPVCLSPVNLHGSGDAVSEDDIQALVHKHPSVLPISEIDPAFVDPVPICRELMTPAGPIDNFMVTASGFPVLVECKLWRNAEARREVVGQILDYAKELARFNVSDLQREASRRLGERSSALFDRVKAAAPLVNETEFNDALTANLRRGRFLLLIVGDGIRERVESIAEYLQAHAGLHFSFGLVELAIFSTPDGGRLVLPRVLAHTTIITRTVIAIPDGHMILDTETSAPEDDADPETTALGDLRQTFWSEFLSKLRLDDPEQPIPRPSRQGYLNFMLPAPGGSSWLSIYRDMRTSEVGIFLSYTRGRPGEYAIKTIAEDWKIVEPLLGGTAQKIDNKDERPRIVDRLRVGSLDQPDSRAKAFEWLAERTNTFINVLRPRVRSAALDYAARKSENIDPTQ